MGGFLQRAVDNTAPSAAPRCELILRCATATAQSCAALHHAPDGVAGEAKDSGS